MLLDKLENRLIDFVIENSKYFNSFDRIDIYYDKGQELLMKIIRSDFKNTNNIKIKIKFNYNRLFQIADMLTFVDKVVYKELNKLILIKTEKLFFNEFNAIEIIRKISKSRK